MGAALALILLGYLLGTLHWNKGFRDRVWGFVRRDEPKRSAKPPVKRRRKP